MKVFVALSALLVVASATPIYLASPSSLLAPPATSYQYQSQDGTGQYAYGYNDYLSAKQELKSLDGVTRGSYSYIDSNNVLQTVDYIADAGGFRVSATNLPKAPAVPAAPVQDLPQQVAETPEVAAAKSAHLAAIEEAKLGLGSSPLVSYPTADLPQQVQDTSEVYAAKISHLAAIEEAKKQATVLPAPALPLAELPKPIEDTPEVAKAKAEHLIAIEQAKLRNSYQIIPQSAPLVVSQIPLSAGVGFPAQGGFSYSSSILNAPLARYGYGAYGTKYQIYSL